MNDVRSQADPSQLGGDGPAAEEGPHDPPRDREESTESAAPDATSADPAGSSPEHDRDPESAGLDAAFEDVEAAVGRLDDLTEEDVIGQGDQIDEREIQDMLAAVEQLDDADPPDGPAAGDSGGGDLEAAGSGGADFTGPAGTEGSTGDQTSGNAPAAAAETAPVADAPTEEDASGSSSRQSGPQWVRREPTTPDRDPTLSEVDKALADDIENIVPDDFESIDAVLNAVFEESAAVLQNDDHGSTAVRSTMYDAPASGSEAEPSNDTPGGDAAEIAPGDPPAAAQSADTPENAQSPESPEPPERPETAAPPNMSGTPETAASPQSPGRHQASDVAPAPVSTPDEHDQRVERADAPAPDRSTPAAPTGDDAAPAGREASATVSATDPPPSTSTHESSDGGAISVMRLWRERIEPAARPVAQRLRRWTISALTLLAWPLAISPQGVRMAVSWLALTLVFWVPVVWVLVFLFL